VQLLSAKNKPMEVRDLFWTFIQSLIENLDIPLSFIRKESAFLHIHPYEKLNGVDSMEKLGQHMKETVRRIQKYYQDEHGVNDPNSIENDMNIIRENLTKDFTLEQIARCVHLAPTYFSILFKNKTGMSYIDYKTKLRMDMARNLLETTRFSLNEISNQVGYNDQKYFSRLFKKYTGTYPHEYRK
jgi:two-component system response regulator YesN